MIIEEMKKRKEELGYTDEQIAIRSGVPLGIVESLFAGESGVPKHQVIQNAIWRTIDEYIQKNEGKCFSTTAPCDVQLREEKVVQILIRFAATSKHSPAVICQAKNE